MANTRSAKKRIRQNEKRRLRNKSIRTRTRTFMKKALAAIESGDVEAAREAVRAAVRQLDRAYSKGVFHRNKVARHKSRLMRRLAQLAGSH